ncbi:MAG: WYL domain-containing protein [Gemmatimonadota bacterium]
MLPMNSQAQFNRIVSLVAELTRRSRLGAESARLDDLARQFDATRTQIQADIRALTAVGDNPDADWMLSLNVSQEGDRVSISSAGPFQRPIRFARDELLAVQLGLATVAEADQSLTSALAKVLETAEPVHHALPGRGRVSPSVSNLVRGAITDRQRLELKYAGEASLSGVNRVVHPYQLLEQQGYTYIVAWCELADGWRHFRLDRIIDALPAGAHYVPRTDFIPANDSFAEPPEGTTPVQVRFSPGIARWLKEHHPDAVTNTDGGLVVTYAVASPEWLIRHVLFYGPEAEVLGPQSYRELMRNQLTGASD